MKAIFTIQKHCVRILFGDYGAYIDKFCTCARARPLDNQKLGSEFYCREHTKMLFNDNRIIASKNLHYYFCILEIFKILKFQCPVNLCEMYSKPVRSRSLLMRTPKPSIQFSYTSSNAWNITYKKLLSKSSFDLTTKVSHFKTELKAFLLTRQKIGSVNEWQSPNFLLC